jgi:hypothetical protein
VSSVDARATIGVAFDSMPRMVDSRAGWSLRRSLGLRFAAALGLAAVLGACGASRPVTGLPFKGDPANLRYELGGVAVQLVNGAHQERTGEGADDFIATDLTQAGLDADFDGDGHTDRVVVLTRDEGYDKNHYVAVVLDDAGTLVPTNSILLGKNVLVERIDLHAKGFVVSLTVPTAAPAAAPAVARAAPSDTAEAGASDTAGETGGAAEEPSEPAGPARAGGAAANPAKRLHFAVRDRKLVAVD